jgi:hypothetical protein
MDTMEDDDDEIPHMDEFDPAEFDVDDSEHHDLE